MGHSEIVLKAIHMYSAPTINELAGYTGLSSVHTLAEVERLVKRDVVEKRGVAWNGATTYAIKGSA